MMTSEDLSVTISLYNKEKTIERAVESIITQPKQPHEIIIVDDGSTDRGPEIAGNLSRKYKIVTYVRQPNSGVSVARNRGVTEASTRYISFLDADDVWEPTYIMNLVNLINFAKEADFYTLAYQMHSEKGTYKPYADLPDHFMGIVDNPVKTYSDGYGLIHTSAITFKKEFFEKLGGFPEGINFGEDLYLWLKACTEGRLAFNNSVSVTLHKEAINSINRRKLHPYHVYYFTKNLSRYSSQQQKELKNFLIKNIFIQWAAAKIEKNRWQQNVLRSYAFKLSKPGWIILLFSEVIPARFFDMIRKRRIQSRLKK